MRKPLTSKQKQALLIIKDLMHKKGYPPSMEELRKELGLATLSSVQRHTDALKEKGYLENIRGLSFPDTSSKVQIPLVGNVAAGVPIMAIENIEAYIPYESTKIKVDDYFFLRAIGDSMNKANVNGRNIDSGDYVLVRKQNTADYGQIVVALIGDEATIKKLTKGESHIILQPISSNPANKPIYIFDDFNIQGIVVDVIKAGD